MILKCVSRLLLLGYSATLTLLLMGCATSNNYPQVTHDGLQLLEKSAFAQVYAKPGASIEGFNQFAVSDCQVAFKKNWQRNQNSNRLSATSRVSKEDMAEIRQTLAALCQEAFESALLESPAYALVGTDTTNNQTLLLRPSVIDLDIAAPDIASVGRSYSFTTEAGEMTLFLEVVDAGTGEVIYRIVDRQRERGNTQMQWTNRVTNIADAKRILGAWGQQLRNGLDRITATSNG